MLARTTKFQVLAFAVIAVIGVAYLGVRYVGVARWVGAAGYTVRVDLPAAGGIFSNAEITYRGVAVGRVGDMRLTRTGIQVDADITADDDIPADVEAVVANRSVIGEQYLDLRPRRQTGPYLRDGSVIHARDTALPPPVEDVLLSTDRFARSVPLGSLQTVVDELYLATQGSGQDLQSLITTSKQFFGAADHALPQTIDLITTSKTVLASQQRESQSIKTFGANLARIGAQLRRSDGDIRTVLGRAQSSLAQANALIDDIKGSAHGLLSNLLTTSQVFLANKDGLRELLVKLPVAVTAGGSVITPNGINVGLVPTFFDPLPCTAGYGGTTPRTGLDTTGNPALNLRAGCRAAGSDQVVRGSRNAPGGR
ncbi:phospholipid/cholesterol/gamma-HCH transport system substrate-binding protein [Jatrophihabitans endophyticus]|uniref:Phospholipid/cholesterol/gamma-HCH transport system substrate-binding protein n=1 Tax=Jatrophihabitans endophyticus TaxID=1206085 RepID=A0A1M5ET47_9ACTN|nr:MlaD family protein [Jatrophihabitans endophyticus]SHF82438.1 phospholipid/cholesterol/gamma-HCH transport system substrate-binding protein [Jatrophihabitans endophyticus]